jgi:RNA polymerase sigma-70 factor (sigma-E family)
LTFDEFATARLQPLLRYATMLTGDPHLAADLVQEVMVRAQLKWRRVIGSDVPELYVRRMVTNAYLDWRRAPWWRRNTLWARPEDAPTAGIAVDHAESAADRDEVWALLRTLPHRQRAALVLRFYEGLRDAEIAEVLGCAVGTVGSLVSRGLATLRAGLAQTTSMEARQ